VYQLQRLLLERGGALSDWHDSVLVELPSCVECHNPHPRSPKRDFKSGDVMGALVVRVPLEF